MEKKLIKTKLFLCLLAVCILFGGFSVATAMAESNEKISVEKPTLSATSFVYDGEAKTVSAPVSDYYVTETVTRVNAGTYYVTVTLRDNSRYEWADGTTDPLRLPFTIEKAVFDEQSLIYESKEFDYNGKEHYITVGNLPEYASVVFNTIKTEPGRYESMVKINVGNNYTNSEITLSGAVLTIKATVLSSENVSITSASGIDPDYTFDAKKSQEAGEFKSSIGSGNKLLATYDVTSYFKGEESEFPNGEYTVSILVPERYSGVKILVMEDGKIVEKQASVKGYSVSFTTNGANDFAIVYTGLAEGDSWIWLEILLGVIIVGEAVGIVLQVLKLKKL